MPLPKPRKNESKEDFIARFMSSSDVKHSRRMVTRDQKLAVAYQQYRKRKKK